MIDDYRVMFQIVASLTDDSSGIIYNSTMFIVLQNFFPLSLTLKGK